MHQMFEDRGYTQIERVGDMISSEHAVGIVFSHDDIRYKVGIQELRRVADEWPGHRIVAAAHGGATPYAGSNVSEVLDEPVEFFTVRELYRNITRHALVPRHERVSTDAARAMMIQYGFDSIDACPRIVCSDPVARYYNFELGEVIKITRNYLRSNGTTREDVTYRTVVSD
jgi:DNA-directed RNA polymerase subunit H (RpoH/RPB5)